MDYPERCRAGPCFQGEKTMFKSSIVKWAVAAVLAMPAVPMLASTTHHRLVTRTHHRLVKSHRLSTRTHRHSSLSARRRLAARRLAKTHRLTHRSTVRHTAMDTTSHFKVHVTKMPPTIDGINT
jgi:hypothetical protein